MIQASLIRRQPKPTRGVQTETCEVRWADATIENTSTLHAHKIQKWWSALELFHTSQATVDLFESDDANVSDLAKNHK